MTKKEFIWLGIRAVGVYSLLILLHHVFQLTWITGYWGLLKIREANPGNYTLPWTRSLISFSAPLLLTVYFLFFGTLIYKLIDRCVKSQPEDLTKPAGYCYCEIIIRFLGLWIIGMMIHTTLMPLRIYLDSALRTYLNTPEGTLLDAFASTSQYFLGTGALFSLLTYMLLGLFFGWYFLKKGTFFINLLGRLWQEKK